MSEEGCSTSVTVSVHGTRLLLQEVQALCTQPAAREAEDDDSNGSSGSGSSSEGSSGGADGEGSRSDRRSDAMQRMYRQAIGVDYKQFQKLLQILAQPRQGLGRKVLSCGFMVNVVGGIELTEPSAELGVALALASAFTDVPVPMDMVFLGEARRDGVWC